jgi:hypothetical protein
MFMKQHFNGHIRFDLYCKGEVCNPPQGMIVSAHVKNKNALGLLAESKLTIDDTEVPVLDIIVPKKATGIMSEIDLDNVQIGDQIWVMVMGKRYQLNDTIISIIGRAVNQPSTHEIDDDIDEQDNGAFENDNEKKPKARNDDDVLSELSNGEEGEDAEDGEEAYASDEEDKKIDVDDGDEGSIHDDDDLNDLNEDLDDEEAESDGGGEEFFDFE